MEDGDMRILWMLSVVRLCLMLALNETSLIKFKFSFTMDNFVVNKYSYLLVELVAANQPLSHLSWNLSYYRLLWLCADTDTTVKHWYGEFPLLSFYKKISMNKFSHAQKAENNRHHHRIIASTNQHHHQHQRRNYKNHLPSSFDLGRYT